MGITPPPMPPVPPKVYQEAFGVVSSEGWRRRQYREWLQALTLNLFLRAYRTNLKRQDIVGEEVRAEYDRRTLLRPMGAGEIPRIVHMKPGDSGLAHLLYRILAEKREESDESSQDEEA